MSQERNARSTHTRLLALCRSSTSFADKLHRIGAILFFWPHQSVSRTQMGRGSSLSLSLVQSRALLGLQAESVTVEVHQL